MLLLLSTNFQETENEISMLDRLFWLNFSEMQHSTNSLNISTLIYWIIAVEFCVAMLLIQMHLLNEMQIADNYYWNECV